MEYFQFVTGVIHVLWYWTNNLICMEAVYTKLTCSGSRTHGSIRKTSDWPWGGSETYFPEMNMDIEVTNTHQPFKSTGFKFPCGGIYRLVSIQTTLVYGSRLPCNAPLYQKHPINCQNLLFYHLSINQIHLTKCLKPQTAFPDQLLVRRLMQPSKPISQMSQKVSQRLLFNPAMSGPILKRYPTKKATSVIYLWVMDRFARSN